MSAGSMNRRFHAPLLAGCLLVFTLASALHNHAPTLPGAEPGMDHASRAASGASSCPACSLSHHAAARPASPPCIGPASDRDVPVLPQEAGLREDPPALSAPSRAPPARA